MNVAPPFDRPLRSAAGVPRPAGDATSGVPPGAHPPADDAAPAATGADEGRDGSAVQRISAAIVGIYKTRSGKGPKTIRIHLTGDTVMAVLRGGFSVVEESLHSSGHGVAVRDQRRALGDAIGPALSAAVTDVLGRDVVAVLADTCQHPDLTAIVLVLAPPDA